MTAITPITEIFRSKLNHWYVRNELIVENARPLKRQCAWCKSVAHGKDWIESDYLLPDATHTICPACVKREHPNLASRIEEYA